jgi:ComF family protein
VRAYARYTGRLVQALLHLKYRPDRKLASVMADWLTGLYPHSEWQASLVVPVPLSRSRFQQRGFNQAELLARELAERLELPMAASQLRRVRETRSQVGLDPSERSLNVKGAFAAERGVFAGEAVLLVDDLYTTGATLAACAQAVLADGGGPVWGLTVGRA